MARDGEYGESFAAGREAEIGERLRALRKELPVREIRRYAGEIGRLKKALAGRGEERALAAFRKTLTGSGGLSDCTKAAEGLTELRRSWNALKSAASLAAAEVESAAAPALTGAAEWGIAAANAVNQFAAALQGKSTFRKLEIDLAKEQNGFRKANGAAKAYRATLLSFDEIHRLSEKTGGTGWKSGTSRAGKQTVLKTGAIDETIGKLADMIRKSDFTGAGKLLGEKLGEAADSVDWQTLGRKLGGGISGAFALAGGFFSTGAMEKLGRSTADFLNGVIEGVQPEAMGKGVAGLLFAGVEYGLGVLKVFRAGEAAEKLSGVIRAILDETRGKIQAVDWTAAGTALIDALGAFFASFDFTGIAVSFWETFGSFWRAVFSIRAAGVSEAAASFLSLFRKAFFDQDGGAKSVGEIGIGIRDAILRGFLFFWGGTAYRQAVEPFLRGLRDAFRLPSGDGFFQESGRTVVSKLLLGVIEAVRLTGALIAATGLSLVKGIFGEEAYEKAKEAGKTVVSAVAAGIVLMTERTPFASLAASIIKAFFNPLCGAANDFDGKLAGIQKRMAAITAGRGGSSGNTVAQANGALPGYYTQMKAEGGYVGAGQLFIANEAGPELVGTVNGRTAVAPNAEITGIANAVYATGEREVAAINNLIRALNAKDMTAVVTADSIVAGLARKNRRDGVSTVPVSV